MGLSMQHERVSMRFDNAQPATALTILASKGAGGGVVS